MMKMRLFNFFRRNRETHKPSEVYVVGRVVSGHSKGVQQVIGVAETLDEAYDICIDHVMQRFGGDYEYEITKWENCCNIRTIFASGIMYSHTFTIQTHEVKKGR